MDCGAEKNEEMLRELIKMDEGAAYLGEVALVPFSSPINKSGILFYNTLFDENAVCHLALGRGFTNVLRDYEKYTEKLIDEGYSLYAERKFLGSFCSLLRPQPPRSCP